MTRLLIVACLPVLLAACDSTQTTTSAPATDSVSKVAEVHPPSMPALPSHVVYKNWEMGKPGHLKLILDMYTAWDNRKLDTMATYFADSAVFDFPEGSRMKTGKNAEAIFRAWRHEYKETSNKPFSLMSLYNKDVDQEWVVAWLWNKWQYTNGKRDSMLYCDNWRIKDGKIVYLNCLQNRTTRALSKSLNENIPE